MCGIVGGIAMDPSRLKEALQIISHRGPDARSIWTCQERNVFLGHVRLSIIDLNPDANQPMICRRSGNVIVFNGEIYNYRAIRSKLENRGWEFRTRSDTEVLLAAYGEWGANCLDYLNGMFAFAVYDLMHGQILLARDRIGKKPLYYSLTGGNLTFASELKGLIAARPELPRMIDESALKEYLGLGYIPGELSIYKEVRKLKAAHYAVFDLNSKDFISVRYWDLPLVINETISEDEAAEELESLLKDAVRIRLESDVPIGTFLSGGLDSSLVTALAVRENPDIIALTASFPVSKYDESSIASQVAKWIGIRHQVITVECAQWDLLAKLAWQFDEPFADSSLLPTYVISEAIRKHVTVALSGDGGDELFAGYDFYDLFMNEAWVERIPLSIRRILSYSQKMFPLGMHGKNFLRRLPFNGVERFMQLAFCPEGLNVSPIQEDIQSFLNCLPIDGFRNGVAEQLKMAPLSLLQQITRMDFYSYLTDDILVKVDRASMLSSLEVRSPLLDYRIAEFAFSLPDRLRLRSGFRKYLLKKIAMKYLPPDYPYDRKQGFSLPETEWFRGPWSRNLENTIHHGLLSKSNVNKIILMHAKNGRCGKTLFAATMLAKWENEYLVKNNHVQVPLGI